MYLSDHQILSKFYINRNGTINIYLKLVINLTYFISNKVIVVSESVKKDLLKISFLNQNKIKVINNPAFLSSLLGGSRSANSQAAI